MSQLLSQLNPVQQEAVKHLNGPLLVLAGAGSGKTRIITYRIAYLIEQGILPPQIMAVTFTNKAAQEMLNRVNDLLGVQGNPVWIATMHATCARILRREIEVLDAGYARNFSIVDAGDQLSIIKRCMKEMDISQKYCKPTFYTRLFSSRKNEIINEENWQERDDYNSLKLDEMWDLYHKRLVESNCLDFDDLLVYTYLLFNEHPEVLERYQRRWRYQMVDEFQDINTLQYDIIKRLAQSHQNIFVVGDDDQSIYKWRGADVENILGFDRDFKDTKMIILDQNYRSSKNIIEAASRISNKITKRKKKKLWTENKQGSKINIYIAENEYDEARYCVSMIKDFYHRDHYNWDEFAILYRTNAQSRVLEEMLMENAIPYYLVGEIGFYKRREIKDLLAYLNLISDPLHRTAFLRIINVPARGLGLVAVERILEFAEQQGLPLMSVITDKQFLDTVSPKARHSLRSFSQLINTCYDLTRDKGAFIALQHLITAIDYKAWLEKDNDIQAQSRLENVGQLFNALDNYIENNRDFNNTATLKSFLEKTALASEADEYEKKSDKVALMTLHCAKGLEFPIVFLAGMVEGLLPHSLSLSQDRSQIDEERRLCYVGITRARRHLFLTCPMTRKYFGRLEQSKPSRFARDIPRALTTVEQSPKVPYNPFWSPPVDHYPVRPRHRKRIEPPKIIKTVETSVNPDIHQKHVKPTDDASFRLGTTVKHPRWGDGMVIKITGSGDHLKLMVSFPGFGRKMLLAHLAPIQIIEY